MALTNKLTDIADAIREKTDTTESMKLDDMPDMIRGIKGGATVTYEENSFGGITVKISNGGGK